MTENEFLSVYHEPEARQEKPSVGPGEIVLGTFVGMDQDGRPLVDFAQNPSGEPLRAISTLSLTRHQLDRTVALLFSAGDLTQPVIMGLIHEDRKSTRLNSSHVASSYAVFCLNKISITAS